MQKDVRQLSPTGPGGGGPRGVFVFPTGERGHVRSAMARLSSSGLGRRRGRAAPRPRFLPRLVCLPRHLLPGLLSTAPAVLARLGLWPYAWIIPAG